jgi:hypothetical protein
MRVVCVTTSTLLALNSVLKASRNAADDKLESDKKEKVL